MTVDLQNVAERVLHVDHAILSLLELEPGIREDPSFEGRVRIATPGSIGLRLYRQLLSLQCRHPGLIIEHRFAPNAEIQRLLLDQLIDVGLMTCPASAPDIGSRAVGEERLQLVTPASVTEASWDVLMQLGFVDHPDGAHHANLLLGPNFPAFRHAGQFPRAGFSNQIALIAEPVALGLGFTVLPSHAIEAFHGADRLRIHPLAQPVSETLYLVQHTRRGLPSRVQIVISEIEACIAGAYHPVSATEHR